MQDVDQTFTRLIHYRFSTQQYQRDFHDIIHYLVSEYNVIGGFLSHGNTFVVRLIDLLFGLQLTVMLTETNLSTIVLMTQEGETCQQVDYYRHGFW